MESMGPAHLTGGGGTPTELEQRCRLVAEMGFEEAAVQAVQAAQIAEHGRPFGSVEQLAEAVLSAPSQAAAAPPADPGHGAGLYPRVSATWDAPALPREPSGGMYPRVSGAGRGDTGHSVIWENEGNEAAAAAAAAAERAGFRRSQIERVQAGRARGPCSDASELITELLDDAQ
jgi:hypothetical protein